MRAFLIICLAAIGVSINAQDYVSSMIVNDSLGVEGKFTLNGSSIISITEGDTGLTIEKARNIFSISGADTSNIGLISISDISDSTEWSDNIVIKANEFNSKFWEIDSFDVTDSNTLMLKGIVRSYAQYNLDVVFDTVSSMSDSLRFRIYVNRFPLSDGDIIARVYLCSDPGTGYCNNLGTYEEITDTGYVDFIFKPYVYLGERTLPSLRVDVQNCDADSLEFSLVSVSVKRNNTLTFTPKTRLENITINPNSIEINWEDFLIKSDTGSLFNSWLSTKNFSQYQLISDTNVYDATKTDLSALESDVQSNYLRNDGDTGTILKLDSAQVNTLYFNSGDGLKVVNSDGEYFGMNMGGYTFEFEGGSGMLLSNPSSDYFGITTSNDYMELNAGSYISVPGNLYAGNFGTGDANYFSEGSGDMNLTSSGLNVISVFDYPYVSLGQYMSGGWSIENDESSSLSLMSLPANGMTVDGTTYFDGDIYVGHSYYSGNQNNNMYMYPDITTTYSNNNDFYILGIDDDYSGDHQAVKTYSMQLFDDTYNDGNFELLGWLGSSMKPALSYIPFYWSSSSYDELIANDYPSSGASIDIKTGGSYYSNNIRLLDSIEIIDSIDARASTGSIDTTSLSNRIDEKISYSDTASIIATQYWVTNNKTINYNLLTFNDSSYTGASSYTLDLSAYNVHKVALTNATTTLSFANGQTASYIILLTQDATGGRTVSWSGNWLAPDGTIDVNTAANSKTLITGFFDGTYMIISEVTYLSAP